MANEIRSPARKRTRRLESTRDSSAIVKELEIEPESELDCKNFNTAKILFVDRDTHAISDDQAPSTQTELETSLPPVRTDQEAIDEYETSNIYVGAESGLQTLEERYASKAWVKGKSSIYVDAFNLALQCVLDEEAHLFDPREIAMFDHWKGLSYQSQYL